MSSRSAKLHVQPPSKPPPAPAVAETTAATAKTVSDGKQADVSRRPDEASAAAQEPPPEPSKPALPPEIAFMFAEQRRKYLEQQKAEEEARNAQKAEGSGWMGGVGAWLGSRLQNVTVRGRTCAREGVRD